MKQALYIDGKTIQKIKWDHGALKLLSDKQSPLWVPLHKISHINIFKSVDWQGKALQKCMQKNITISFADKQGYIGLCSGKSKKKAHLYSQLVGLFIQHSHHLPVWFHAQQQRRLKQLSKRFHIGKKTLTKTIIRQRLNEHITKNYHYYNWEKDLQKLHMPLVAQHYQILPYYGFSQSQLQQYKPLNELVNCLLKLSIWEYWQYACQGELPKSSQNKHLVLYYHQHQQQIETLTRQYIHSLWTTLSNL